MNTMMKMLLISSLLVLSSSNVFASESIGTIVKVRGDVTVMKSGSSEGEQVSPGYTLKQGDVLSSSGASFAKILMADDTIFQLGPKSKFAIEEFVMKDKKDKAKRKATYNLVHGKLRSIFTVKSPEKSLHIKTPTATMGIRGTEILSDVYKMNGAVHTDIALMTGKLEINELPREGVKARVYNIKPGEMFETKMRSLKARLPNSENRAIERPKKRVKRMSKKLFRMLKRKDNKGEVFLHDARKKEDPKMFKRVEFQLSKRERKLNRADKGFDESMIKNKDLKHMKKKRFLKRRHKNDDRNPASMKDKKRKFKVMDGKKPILPHERTNSFDKPKLNMPKPERPRVDVRKPVFQPRRPSGTLDSMRKAQLEQQQRMLEEQRLRALQLYKEKMQHEQNLLDEAARETQSYDSN